ncbi:hypothetical protein OB2597_12928 [Pseudooceanicola batsensis HTCC2597]|uniref:Aminoglycoside phosphotransferase domain-containing protein n=1 Tax=Pseudooceanicola batsensis (strain ATCC BAA-863 / DSM 15984 / KCTC 12145 / HTCC2597) TaxID=252305 RepID=A3TY14_PSEBH|nr:hypothetical protein OB2597_12928 [Pseudooceanicola batsensis HTCC2597]
MPGPDLVAAVTAELAGPVETWVPLRGGRTNRVWRMAGAAGDLVLKLYLPGAETPLFPNDPEAEFRILSRLAPAGLAPSPVARLKGAFGHALIYRFLEGPTWDRDLVAMARLLHRVHGMAPPQGLGPLPSGSAELRAQARGILSRCRGAADPALARLETRVAARPAVPPCAAPRLIHRDPVAGNVIDTARGPVLIDWQCPALGDPCEDLAIVLSPFMQRAYLGHLLTEDEAATFLAAYPDAETVARYRRLAPFFHWRMAAYALWCEENGRDAGPTDRAREISAAARLA